MLLVLIGLHKFNMLIMHLVGVGVYVDNVGMGLDCMILLGLFFGISHVTPFLIGIIMNIWSHVFELLHLSSLLFQKMLSFLLLF